MEKRSAFFFSPVCTSGDTSYSLPTGMLFSPYSPAQMDTSSGEAQPDQKMASSTATPRRRLSLDVDENAQSPFSLDVDAGYSDSYNGSSCSSLEASLNGNVGLESSQESGISLTSRTTLGEIRSSSWNSPGSGFQRKTLLARRLSRRKVSSSITEEDRENPICNSPTPLRFSRPSPNLHRPSSLPAFPLSPLTQDMKPRNFIKQISSPLERMTLMSPTPVTTHSHRPPSIVESDGYFSEAFDNEDSEEAVPLSATLSSLITAPLTHSPRTTTFVNKPQLDGTSSRDGIVCPTPIRPPYHRSNSSVLTGGVRRRVSLKRSSPCSNTPQQRCKRPPLPVFGGSNSNGSPPKKALKGISLLRSQSCSTVPQGEARFFPASPGNGDCEWIGDFSKVYALPLIKGSIADLKSITPETYDKKLGRSLGVMLTTDWVGKSVCYQTLLTLMLAKLLGNKYSHVVDTFTVVDCRYPYEYVGGHIKGAVNIWEKETLLDRFFSSPEHPCEGKRSILIFHCEFSSKRGPDMSRFMRETDRKRNGMDFPKLYYPEVYLLDGGYKAFYEQYSSLCEPMEYQRMQDENHKEDLKHFKHRSKSWNCESRSRCRPPSLRPRRSTVFDRVTAYESTGNST